MVVDKPEDKVSWNKKALIALVSKDERASSWRGTLYNNIGMNYLEAELFKEAYEALQIVLDYRIKRRNKVMIRGAKWQCSASWRVGHVDEGLNGLLALENEYRRNACCEYFEYP